VIQCLQYELALPFSCVWHLPQDYHSWCRLRTSVFMPMAFTTVLTAYDCFAVTKKTSELELELSLLAPMGPPFSRPQHSDFDLDLTKTLPESRWKICVPSAIWISPIIWSPIRNIQECTCWWLIIAQKLTKLRLWILGDSQSIFPSLDKMWNFSSLQKLRKMTSLKQFIKLELMCKGVVWLVSIPHFHKGFNLNWFNAQAYVTALTSWHVM